MDKSKISKGMIDELVQKAMSTANDSLHTSLCLQHHAREIAMACIYISANMCKIRPADGKGWPELLNILPEVLTSIVLQITELTAEMKGRDTSIFDSIRKDLDAMKSSSRNSAKRHRPN